jgi:Domain of Unknown Function with PDB structure (DUF3857)/Transglutaminase-like superfamily
MGRLAVTGLRPLKEAAMALFFCAGVAATGTAGAGDAPQWMRAQLAAPLPVHDAKTNAVVLYSETVITVQPNGKMKRLDREVVKILRPDGASRGTVRADYDAASRITGLRAWCIPVTGKDYEAKEKDAVESAVDVDGGELIGDLRTKTLLIPAATPGSVVGYEIEQELRPYMLVDEWGFQDTIPVREVHFKLQLPRGWTYRSNWVNHAEEAPTETAAGQWEWSLKDLPAIRLESHMPPWRGISGRLVIAVVPPDGQDPGIQNWHDMGAWYLRLADGRRAASPAIQRKVAELTAGAASPLEKMRAIARFVQSDIRYVAIELGIGGFQPHAAADTFIHRYGDCKDKVTLMSAMLEEIGVHSNYVLINTTRGSVTGSTPPNLDFNHAILAVELPADLDVRALKARMPFGHGQILFFDPTNYLTAFGDLSGDLQANYGLLVTRDGGELVELPQLAVETNGVQRTATMVLDESGTLLGDVREVRSGDSAAAQRYLLRTAALDTDQIKPVEATVGASLSTYQILKATIANLRIPDQPFEWRYTLRADHYGKANGDLVLVRPRILGSYSSDMMETKEARQHPVEFPGPQRNTDVFEITLPANYTVDDIPAPINVDDGFASYQSKTEMVGHVLRYTRRFEIKELSVPASKAGQLQEFFRIIESDERNSAVLQRHTSS